MAYSHIRSMNRDLEEGMTDGKYKKLTPNRGGVTENELRARTLRDLDDVWFGYHETPAKALPDSTHTDKTHDFVATKPAELL
jgi:hypothetical protein